MEKIYKKKLTLNAKYLKGFLMPQLDLRILSPFKIEDCLFQDKKNFINMRISSLNLFLYKWNIGDEDQHRLQKILIRLLPNTLFTFFTSEIPYAPTRSEHALTLKNQRGCSKRRNCYCRCSHNYDQGCQASRDNSREPTPYLTMHALWP
ncbi:hypothetical protein L6164_018325 [Bauhinia variegata]|uniref:Uncharacterized protein n=1 Tax=Bauhinia variegata TaxID=167791 RepID=A0ACB9NAZ4_BAUVA|nr:hypothetical protein L6164_018325 [Bauhinia variegata]